MVEGTVPGPTPLHTAVAGTGEGCQWGCATIHDRNGETLGSPRDGRTRTEEVAKVVQGNILFYLSLLRVLGTMRVPQHIRLQFGCHVRVLGRSSGPTGRDGLLRISSWNHRYGISH